MKLLLNPSSIVPHLTGLHRVSSEEVSRSFAPQKAETPHLLHRSATLFGCGTKEERLSTAPKHKEREYERAGTQGSASRSGPAPFTR